MGRSKRDRFEAERAEFIERSSTPFYGSGIEGARSPLMRGAPWSTPFRWRNLLGPLLVLLALAAPFVIAILMDR